MNLQGATVAYVNIALEDSNGALYDASELLQATASIMAAYRCSLLATAKGFGLWEHDRLEAMQHIAFYGDKADVQACIDRLAQWAYDNMNQVCIGAVTASGESSARYPMVPHRAI